MKAFVGVTDFDWFTSLSAITGLDEVNFWQPSGKSRFQSLIPGEPFLFKLHSPRDFIVGGGFFAHSTILPVSLAWSAFGEKNGACSLEEMRNRIERYRRSRPAIEDYHIGCILLEQPFFFYKDDWISVPEDWFPNIVRGKTYDTATGIGQRLWENVLDRLSSRTRVPNAIATIREGGRYGSPILITPRLGQGSFRIIVTDTYERRCAITGERTLPALEASHIKPFTDSGPNSVRNGILLRSDIHRLFDTGYVTVTRDYRFEVGRRIKEEFENGRDYYAMHGRTVHTPVNAAFRPEQNFIKWHNENVFRG